MSKLARLSFKKILSTSDNKKYTIFLHGLLGNRRNLEFLGKDKYI